MSKPILPPQLVLLIGILAAATAAIFIRQAQQVAPSLVIAAWRLGLATLLLAPFALTRRRAELKGLDRRQGGLAILSGIFLALHFATWITSLAYTSVASSVVFVSTTPLWVALLSPLFLKEKVGGKVWLGMGLAFLGGVTVAFSDICSLQAGSLTCPPVGEFFQGRAFIGDLLALCGAWMAAGYLVIGRRLRASTSLLGYVFIVYGMAAVALVVAVFVSGTPLTGYPPETFAWFLLLALIPQLLGHSSFNYALGYLSAAYVSISLLGEPIASTLLAYFLLGEAPGAIKLIGAILILCGIYLASLAERVSVAPASQPDLNLDEPETG